MARTVREPLSKCVSLLIVDDSVMMRAMIKRAANLSNVALGAIYEASNGAEALRVLEANDVDAVFTDVNMPVMTGIELLQAIEREARWPDLLKVIISTDGSTAHHEEATRLGARAYVEKPFKPEAIRAVLTSLL